MLFAQNTYSATWYVNDISTTGDIFCTAVGNNANAGNTPALPKLTLAAAYALASAGDTIYVDRGKFDEENIAFNKAITIIGSGNGSTVFDASALASDTTPTGPSGVNYRFGTITASNVIIKNISLTKYALNATGGNVFRIDGALTGVVLESILIHENRGTSNGLQNIVIVNGANVHIKSSFFKCAGYNASSGGGIQVNGSTLLVENSVFFESEGLDSNGGAINIQGTAPNVTVNNCTFYDNHAKRGGAIGMVSGTLSVNNSCFDNNNIVGSTPASSDGGGAFYISNGTATFNHCSFKNNCVGASGGCATSTTPRGGAIYVIGGTTNLNNCEFKDNVIGTAARGADIHLKDGGTANITNCFFRTIYAGSICNVANESATAINWSNSGTPTASPSGVVLTNPETTGTMTTTGGSNNTNNPSGTVNSNCISASSISACGVTINCATDTVAPIIISCVPNKTLTCPAVMPNYTSEVAFYDDCTATVTQSIAVGTLLTAGVYTVTMTVTDQNNNSSSCSFTVTVTGTPPAAANFSEFASAVYVSTNGGTSSTFYNTTGSGVNLIGPSNFASTNLGNHTINSSSLKLTGAEIKTWKNGSGNVCGGTLYYVVYPTGARPTIPTFSQVPLIFKANCSSGTFTDGVGPCSGSDQKWQNDNGNNGSFLDQNIDLTSRPIGNYTLEVFYSYTGSDTGGCGTTQYITNSCNNYAATFTVSSACVSPSISAQPSSTQTVCQNAVPANISVTASGDGLTYQWYSNTLNSNSGGTSLGSANGAQTSAYTPVTSTSGTNYYYCVITGTCGNVTSSTSEVIVDATTVAGTASSDQTICNGSQPADITLASTTGLVIKWQKSSDFAFTTPIDIASTSTTLTGALIGTLSSTTYFRAVVQNGSCSVQNSNVVTITVPYSTWDGTAWSNGVPTIATTVTFTGNYNATTDMFACSLLVTNNANVVINSGFDYTVYGKVTVDTGSTLTFNNNSNLIQQTNIANSGNIKMKRNTNPLMRLDYTLWGAPVTGQNLLAFSPSTLSNRFYTYNTSTNLYNAISPSTTSFMPGDGYQIRTPNNHPTTPTIWTGTFEGVPNNGPYTKTISNISPTQRYNMVGNPYPSPIDMYLFTAANSANMTGTIWFWRKTNSTVTQSIWSTWNSGTFVAANEPYVTDPNDLIRNGQAFLIKASDTGTSVTFNNSMRVTDNSNQFFRIDNNNNSVNTIEKHRIWLNVFNSNNNFFQQAVTYIQGGTIGLDQFDGENSSDTSMMFTSSIPNNSDAFVIQSRPLPFDVNDIVPLNFVTNVAGTYSIAIDHKDGLFSTNTQNIFILDKYLQTYNNINNGPYSFNSDAGNFTDRFELRFVETSLSSNEYNYNNSIIVYSQNGEIIINSAKEALKDVKLFDIRGRLLDEKKNINLNEIIIKSFVEKEVLLLQITTESGKIINKKIII